MRFTSQPASVASDEAAARFTRATKMLMRAAERRKAAQALHAAVAPAGLALPSAVVAAADGRYAYHHAQAQTYPASMGGAA